MGLSAPIIMCEQEELKEVTRYCTELWLRFIVTENSCNTCIKSIIKHWLIADAVLLPSFLKLTREKDLNYIFIGKEI